VCFSNNIQGYLTNLSISISFIRSLINDDDDTRGYLTTEVRLTTRQLAKCE
jgi:hypothetical protein